MAREAVLARLLKAPRHRFRQGWDNALRVSEFKVMESLRDFLAAHWDLEPVRRDAT